MYDVKIHLGAAHFFPSYPLDRRGSLEAPERGDHKYIDLVMDTGSKYTGSVGEGFPNSQVWT